MFAVNEKGGQNTDAPDAEGRPDCQERADTVAPTVSPVGGCFHDPALPKFIIRASAWKGLGGPNLPGLRRAAHASSLK